MSQYYTITKLETGKSGYRRELHESFTRQCPEMQITKRRISDKRRAIVSKGLLLKPWLEEIRAQVAENTKVTNLNIVENTRQTIDENE
jgi:hypothetical protein